MNHLETITARQNTGRIRTFVFAACLGFMGLVSVASVQTCVAASHVPAPASHVALAR